MKKENNKLKFFFINKTLFDTTQDYEIACKIQQRRLQMLVHSYIYYELNQNIISDDKFTEWGVELKALQDKYPTIARKVLLNEVFEKFEGFSGYNLPYNHEWVINKAHKLLSYKNI